MAHQRDLAQHCFASKSRITEPHSYETGIGVSVRKGVPDTSKAAVPTWRKLMAALKADTALQPRRS